MFNKDFFPTYPALIEKMIAPHVWKGTKTLRKGISFKRFLEPNAGKGDILDYVNDNYGGYWGRRDLKETKLYAIEIEPELCSILRDKKYKIIGSDFLDFETHLSFDLIVMNPPFSQGAKHLLKAWEISKGGHIVCLLNAKTYDNTFSKERQILKEVIDNYGTVERLGKAFASSKVAERTTNAEIILVRLEKPKVSIEDEFLFNDLETEKHDLGEFKHYNELADRNVLKSYELSYKASIEAYKEVLKAKAKLNHYRRDICYEAKRVLDKKTGEMKIYIPKTDYAKQFQTYIEESNVEAWQTFLRKSKFAGYLTKKVREQFEARFETQKLIAFNERNMNTMLQTLFFSQDNLLLDCIEEAFDNMTKYHYENRIIEEGWKTNDAWRVNKKVILPNQVGLSSWSGFEISWSKRDTLNDIDRAMCYISGLKYDNIDLISTSLEKRFKEIKEIGYSTSNNLTESTFFKMRFYKKGTLHLNFKNEYFWSQFNRKAAEKKGFPLPEKMSFDADYPEFIK